MNHDEHMKKMVKQFHLIIRGDVVGVGYRSWMRREAQRLHIVGWVGNGENKSVEAVVQGEKENIRQIIEKAKKGPDVSWVEEVNVTEQPVDEDLLTFEVIY